MDNSLSSQQFNDSITTIPNVVVLDVRTPDEFAEGHLPDAINVDYKNEQFLPQIVLLDKTLPYYIYCKGGVRSAAAAKLMRNNGFKVVFDLKGGIQAWQSDGFDMVTD